MLQSPLLSHWATLSQVETEAAEAAPAVRHGIERPRPTTPVAAISRRVRVVALCDPVVARAEAAAAKFGVAAAYPDMQSMLAAGGLDAVSIASARSSDPCQTAASINFAFSSPYCITRRPFAQEKANHAAEDAEP